MRRAMFTLGVLALTALLTTSVFAGNRGVTFTPIGFIEDPGPFPASLISGMTGDGSVFVTSPDWSGQYCTTTTTDGDWTEIGVVAGRCSISTDGSAIMAGVYGPEGHYRSAIWAGRTNTWDMIPMPDGMAPCGTSGHGLFAMGGNADFATGLTWEGCASANAYRWDAESNVSVNLYSMNGDDSRGNGISDDGGQIVGWTRQPNGQWRGAEWTDGDWSWIDGLGNDYGDKKCDESGVACTWDGVCPEFVNDGACSNAGACDQTGIECDLAGIECDQAGITCNNAGVTCDLAGVDCVDSVCVGGSNAGDACDGSWNCTGSCNGGLNDGANCYGSWECPGACDGGPNDGGPCTGSWNCPGTCSAGPNTGGSCTGSWECPGTCNTGANEGGSCTGLSQCPGACATGPNEGDVCSYDDNCAGTCTGGPSGGDICTGEWQCPDTSVCNWNPAAVDYKGEVVAITPDGQHILGKNFGNSPYDWGTPNFDWKLWSSAYVRGPEGFTQLLPPATGFEGDSWTPWAISDNGNVVVGTYGWWIYSFPVMWIDGIGTIDFQLFLVGQGLDEVWFWQLQNLSAVSSDGTIVAGNGGNPDFWSEGYVVDMSKVKICLVDPQRPDSERTVAVDFADLPGYLNQPLGQNTLGTCEFRNSGGNARVSELKRAVRPAAVEGQPLERREVSSSLEEYMQLRQAWGAESSTMTPRKENTRGEKASGKKIESRR